MFVRQLVGYVKASIRLRCFGFRVLVSTLLSRFIVLETGGNKKDFSIGSRSCLTEKV